MNDNNLKINDKDRKEVNEMFTMYTQLWFFTMIGWLYLLFVIANIEVFLIKRKTRNAPNVEELASCYKVYFFV